MSLRLLHDLGREHRIAILKLLKRGEGLPVQEIADATGLSYMGAKHHCVALRDQGYVDRWRRPRPVGRPEVLYRLTEKAQALFEPESPAIALGLLESARHLYGATAPEKILLDYFQRKTGEYAARLPDTGPLKRAQKLARLRDAEGRMTEWLEDRECWVEHHNPMQGVFAAYASAARFEEEMIARALGRAVRREESGEGGQRHVVFRLA